MKTWRAVWVAVLIACGGFEASAAAPAKLALQGGRIITVTGPDIADGTLLIENGKITAVGKDVKVPYDAMVVDVAGKVLLPGMIVAHTSQGLDRTNESLAVVPYLDVYDAIDPSSARFENALRNGILAMHVIQGNNCVIGGLSRLVHPIGLTPDEMTIQPTVALKLSTSPKSGSDRMSQMAALRQAFLDLEQYLDTVAERRYEEQLKIDEKPLTVTPAKAAELGSALVRDADCDDKHRNLFKLAQGRLAAWVYCGAATDVAPAIEIAKAEGFLERTVFVLGGDAHRAVGELKAVKRPVVLPAELTFQRRKPISGELQETFVPKVIYDAGITFALLPNTSGSLAEQFPGYQVARCVRNGIPRRAALEAITINPAKLLNVEQRLGSLEVGKEAYVVVLSGDPLNFNTWVEQAYVRGVKAYDRDEDVRLKQLLGMEERFQELAKKRAEAKAKAAAKAKQEAKAKPAAKKKPAAKSESAPQKKTAEKKTAEKKTAEKKTAEKKTGAEQDRQEEK